jgi:hypothetical protein
VLRPKNLLCLVRSAPSLSHDLSFCSKQCLIAIVAAEAVDTSFYTSQWAALRLFFSQILDYTPERVRAEAAAQPYLFQFQARDPAESAPASASLLPSSRSLDVQCTALQRLHLHILRAIVQELRSLLSIERVLAHSSQSSAPTRRRVAHALQQMMSFLALIWASAPSPAFATPSAEVAVVHQPMLSFASAVLSVIHHHR